MARQEMSLNWQLMRERTLAQLAKGPSVLVAAPHHYPLHSQCLGLSTQKVSSPVLCVAVAFVLRQDLL